MASPYFDPEPLWSKTSSYRRNDMGSLLIAVLVLVALIGLFVLYAHHKHMGALEELKAILDRVSKNTQPPAPPAA